VLLVLIVGIVAGDWTGRLTQAGQLVAENPVDQLGNLVFANLAPGSYELIFSGPEVEIHVPGLDIDTS
jgi:hypothetical protein